MFNSQALEVTIGLIFVYLVLSLICSAVKEGISAFMGMRAKTLYQGIAELLGDPKRAQELYDHPLIQGLMKGASKPSYIPARTFANVVIDLVAPATEAGPKTYQEVRTAVAGLPDNIKRPLLVLLDDAGGNLEKARKNIEDWFNQSMDRVCGWYKRWTQLVLFATALVVVAVSNADTLMIVNRLLLDAPTRSRIVVAATENATPSTATSAPVSPGVGQLTSAELNDAQILMGWSASNRPRRGAPFAHQALGWAEKVAGLLLTAIALSLGAPFWFDMLNKLVNLRSSGGQSKSRDKPDK